MTPLVLVPGLLCDERLWRHQVEGLSDLAERAPGRIGALALLDTSARPDTPEQTETRLALIDLARAGRFDEVWQGLLPKVVHPDRVGEPGLRSAVREMAHAVGPEGFERQERAIIGRPDSRGDLPAISCPTLLLCGRDDALTPPHLHEELADGIPGAQLHQIDHCGHLSTLERPEAVTRAMRAWLEALANRPAGDVYQGS